MAGFPYEIYYFSRNMEHVLHDRAENLTDDEKEDLAFYSGSVVKTKI